MKCVHKRKLFDSQFSARLFANETKNFVVVAATAAIGGAVVWFREFKIWPLY